MNLLNPRTSCSALTVIELLFVVGLVSVLTALAFSITGTVRSRTDLAQSVGNQRQIVAALLTYAQEHRGHFPQMVAMDSPISPGYTVFWTRTLVYHGYLSSPASLFAPRRNRWKSYSSIHNLASDSTKPWAYPSYGVNSFGAMPRRIEGQTTIDSPANLQKIGPDASHLMLLRDVWHPLYAEEDHGWYYWDAMGVATAYLPENNKGYRGMMAAGFADGSVKVYPIRELRQWVTDATWGKAPEFARTYTRTLR